MQGGAFWLQGMATTTGKALTSWEYPKKSGIRIREVLNAHAGEIFGGSHLVTIPSRLTGKLRIRRQFKDSASAEKWAESEFAGYRKQGHDFFSLSEQERQEVGATLPLLRQHGISIGEAVRFAVKHLRPEGRTKTVRQVVEELTASKSQRHERGDLRARSYADFEQRAEKFATGFEGRIASEVTAEEIKKWLTGLGTGTRSNRNYLAVIAEVFKLAAQRRYVAFSPLESLTDIDRKELCGRSGDAKEPSILTPAEADRLLNAAFAHPELELLGAVTLGLFCGLRTEELKRLEWDGVKLDETSPVVTIGAKIAKKRRIRHVEIPAVAVRWLSLVPIRKGTVTSNTTYNDHRNRFNKLLGFAKFKKWEANAMRHSFGSYHYALHGNPLETSRLLGHKASDQVLFDYYRALATKAQAEAYFALFPPARDTKVIRFAK
jgi:integrase